MIPAYLPTNNFTTIQHHNLPIMLIIYPQINCSLTMFLCISLRTAQPDLDLSPLHVGCYYLSYQCLEQEAAVTICSYTNK